MPDDGPAEKARCDGQCRPPLHHARCPLHGAPLWRLVMDIEASNAAKRADEQTATDGGGSRA